VDDLLDPAEAAGVRAHLETCATCTGLVADLSRIASTARQLGPIAPPAHVYASITAQLPHTEPGAGQAPTPGHPRRRWATIAATLAAAAALAYVAAGVTRVTVPPDSPGTAAGTFGTVAEELELAVHHYELAIRELQTVTAVDGRLAPDVAASVQRSLGALDVAIAESRQALQADPASEPARTSLFEALHDKIDLLQATALIVSDSQGDPAARSRPAAVTGREL
jgi:anti-sigma factor RsiW